MWKQHYSEAGRPLEPTRQDARTHQLGLLASTAMSCVAHWEALRMRPPLELAARDLSSTAAHDASSLPTTNGAHDNSQQISWMVRAQWRGLQAAIAMLVIGSLKTDPHHDNGSRITAHTGAAFSLPTLLHCLYHGRPELCGTKTMASHSSSAAGQLPAALNQDLRNQVATLQLCVDDFANCLVPAPPLAGLLVQQTALEPSQEMQGAPLPLCACAYTPL